MVTCQDIYKGPRDGDFRVRAKDGTLRICKHAMVIIGYGATEDGKNFYEVQNSWGTGWGDDGYGRVMTDSSLPAG